MEPGSSIAAPLRRRSMSAQIQKFRVDFIKPLGGRVSFAAGYRTDGTNRCQAWEHKKETGVTLTIVIKRTSEGECFHA